MKQYYSEVWKCYFNMNKILLWIMKNTTILCLCLAMWKHNDNFLCYTVLLACTPILDIAPIDVAIEEKLLQYLSLIYETNTTQSVEI